MKVLDTDIVSDYFRGVTSIVDRIAQLIPSEFVLPIIGVEEILRGRLDVIRQAQAGKAAIPVVRAYELFSSTIQDLKAFAVFAYSENAQRMFESWRSAKIRVGSQDLRIAAIAVAHSATLVTRNRRDFELVPGLIFEEWK